jgi:FAD:protein FMN transferase
MVFDCNRVQGKLKYFPLLLLCAGVLVFEKPAPRQTGKMQLYSIARPAMGTVFSLYIYESNEKEANADASLVFDEVDRIEGLLSNYKVG